jgi:hypothetical protein
MLYKTEHGQPTPDWRSLLDNAEDKVSRSNELSHVVIFRSEGEGFKPFLIVSKREGRGIDRMFVDNDDPPINDDMF